MDWSQNVFTNHAFIQYNSILVVVTLPRHVSYQQVLTQSQLTVSCRITFSQDITFLDALTFFTNRTQVNSHALVGLTEFRNTIFFQSRFKAYKLFVFCTVIQNTNCSSIYEIDYTIALSSNLSTWIFTQLSFDTSTNNRSFGLQQRNGLSHHVWSHQRTVRVIMFQERNQRSGNRSNLLRRNVHQLNLIRSYNRIIGITTSFYFLTDESTVIVQRSITLSNDLVFFFFCRQVFDTFRRQINYSILYLTIRSYDKAQIVDLCIDTQRRDQTDVRTFRCFDRTQTTIMSIVYVSHLKTCTVTWQTTRTQSWQTTLMCNFSQRVSLVHELWQSIGSEEWVDHRRDCLRIDQINRSKYFVVAYIHTLTDRTGHTCQTDSELIRQLFTYGTYTTVAQVVNIINICFRVNQLNQILDDFNNIMFGQYPDIHAGVQRQFLVDTVTTNFT